jgi:hypothetical protein
MKSKLGKKAGNVAVAHKIARVVYTWLKETRQYNPEIIVESQQKWKEKRIAYLEKQIIQLKKAI